MAQRDVGTQLDLSPRRPYMLSMMKEITSHAPQDPELPIVELRPFSQKEWRRAKSLPTFWDQKTNLELFSEEDESPRVHFLPITGTRIQLVTTDGNESPRNNKDSRKDYFSKGLMKTPKQSPRESTAKFFDKPPKFGFATLDEREKTTLDEIKTGNSDSIQYSFLKSTLSEENLSKQRDIRLSGEQIRSLSQHGGRTNFYMTERGLSRSYTMPVGDANGDLEFLTRNLYSRLRQTAYCNHSSMPVSHSRLRHWGRQPPQNTALPLIEIRNAPLKPKNNQSTSPSHELPQRHPDYYRVGGIKNTLQVMNEIGKPTGFEQKLSMEINFTLDHLRRTGDTLPATGFPPAGFPPPPSIASSLPRVRFQSALTQGEMLLQEGLRQNTRKQQEKAITGDQSHQSASSFAVFESDEDSISAIQEDVDSISDSGSDIVDQVSTQDKETTDMPMVRFDNTGDNTPALVPEGSETVLVADHNQNDIKETLDSNYANHHDLDNHQLAYIGDQSKQDDDMDKLSDDDSTFITNSRPTTRENSRPTTQEKST